MSLTVSTDEDATTGYMLDDEHAPKTPDERLAMFCLYAAREWDMVLDPRKVEVCERRGFTYDPDEDCLRIVGHGDTADSYWFIFANLDEASIR